MEKRMQPRGEFDSQLEDRIKEIFNRNKPADMDPKTIEESKKSFMSMNASVMGVVHVSMGLSLEQSIELRKVESQRMRSTLFKTFLKRMKSGKDHSEIMHPEMLIRYFETVKEQTALYGERLDEGAPPRFTKPSTLMSTLASEYIKLVKNGNRDMVLASPDLPYFVARADELNRLNEEDVLGSKTGEYVRRLTAANKALNKAVKDALKAKTGVDLDTDTYITRIGVRPPESEKTTVSWMQVTAGHPPEAGLTFRALDKEVMIIEPSVFPALEGKAVDVREDPEAVRANLIGQLRWARTALKPYQAGGRMVEAVFSQGPVTGRGGLFYKSYFRLHPNGVVEKALDVVGEQELLTPHPARVVIMSTVFAVLDKRDKLTFGNHCSISPSRPA